MEAVPSCNNFSRKFSLKEIISETSPRFNISADSFSLFTYANGVKYSPAVTLSVMESVASSLDGSLTAIFTFFTSLVSANPKRII